MVIKMQEEEIERMKKILEVTADEPVNIKASQVSLKRQPRITQGSIKPVVRHLVLINMMDISNNNLKYYRDSKVLRYKKRERRKTMAVQHSDLKQIF